MKLVDLRDLLVSTGITTYHYEAAKDDGNYIVWAEEGAGRTASADNVSILQTLRGFIEYYTKTEFDPLFDLIQEKLNQEDISWSLDTINYNKDTGYIRYVWSWELVP